jgi:hypothetical protein
MWHAWERRYKYTRLGWEGQNERDHLEVDGIDGGIESEWILRRLAWAWSGFIWLRLRTYGEHLWTWW